MNSKQDDILRDKFRKRFESGIDEVLEELKKDQYYCTHLEHIEESISSKDIERLLEKQMTAHNMELEAVYRAGHRDCIYFLEEIGNLK